MADAKATRTQVVQKVYVGQLEHLQGKTALVSPNAPHGVIAQFDDIQTGLAFGWWAFQEREFVSPDSYRSMLDRFNKAGYSKKAAKEKAVKELCGTISNPTPRYV